ncbi:MAG: DUF4973 domain-containing protein [Candidatus Symbiothrix sp.]|jgi:hypothetical protein|nr:DUF4973 domain-containing protein [Candidatus Symbiothrix sp.]
MKKTLIYTIATLLGIAFYACSEDEWKGEQYEKYVSFVRSGYTETYLNTNTPDGTVHYKIPVEVSGSTVNDRNLTVTVALDPDTLARYNKESFLNRTDLFYRQLPDEYYEFPKGLSVTIPAGKDVGYLDIDFTVKGLDLVEKYILPLQIAATSDYIPSPKKYYKKTLMRIIPFNYFSGSYSAVAAEIKADSTFNADGTGMKEVAPPTTKMETREMRFVNDSTVFFYAGLCEENARDRSTYKVQVKFNADNSLTFTADSTQIKFSASPNCKWTVSEEKDVQQPYLIIRTLIMDLEYSYREVSNESYQVKYNLKGFYTLERRRNEQIPEEDQQDIFE